MTSSRQRRARGGTASRAIARLSAAAAALAAALALSACGSSGGGAGNPTSNLTPEQARQPLDPGAPQSLVALRDQADRLLDGGLDAYRARLEQLRGTPVVVNDWASWCGPCRLEFPFFQSLASKRGGQIAFLGANTDDSTGAAQTFLGELPLPYPSYKDPDSEIRHEIGPGNGLPATAFYDRSGKLAYTNLGVYTSEQDLAADVNTYAR